MHTRTHTHTNKYICTPGVAYMMSILLSSQTVDPKTLAPEVGVHVPLTLSRSYYEVTKDLQVSEPFEGHEVNILALAQALTLLKERHQCRLLLPFHCFVGHSPECREGHGLPGFPARAFHTDSANTYQGNVRLLNELSWPAL